jgi:hypothetical protein
MKRDYKIAKEPWGKFMRCFSHHLQILAPEMILLNIFLEKQMVLKIF